MKRIIAGAVVAAAILGFTTARADINITWYSTGGFFDPSDNTSPLLDPPVQSALIQLIGAGADNTPDAVNPVGVNFLGDDDILLAQFVFVNNANDGFSEYAAGNYGTYASASGAGSTFYGRVFQDNSPAPGEKYFDGLATVALTEPDGQTQFYDFNNGNTGGDILPNTILPEPSVLAFLGIGGIVLAVRRRVRKA